MPDFFDDLVIPGQPNTPPTGSPATAPVLPNNTGDFFSGLTIPGTAAPQPQLNNPTTALEPTEEPESWWSKNGRVVEGAAAAGLAMLLGPKLARGAGSLLSKSGIPGQAVLTGAKNVQAIAAPSTVDEAAGRAAAVTRAESGGAAQQTAQTQSRLEPYWPLVGGADPIRQRNFISYVEGRSKGVQLSDPKLQSLADEMRAQYDRVHTDVGNLNRSQKTGFIEDYYRHQWVKDDVSERIFSKEGSKSFTKQRTLPTIEDGIKAGLTPKTLDPVQTTLEYVNNARRFIAANKILEKGEQVGDVIFRPLGYKGKFPTSDSWVPIEGSLGRKGGGQLYAKEGWARVYNNWRSLGFTGPAGDVMHALRRTSNTITGLELGLSGFHFTTMVNEAIINDVAKAVTNITKGKFGEAIKDVALSPTAPIRLAREGSKLQKVYLGKEQGTSESREMMRLLTKAGGRATGISHAKDYEFTAMNSFFDAWKKGALAAEGRQMISDVKSAPVTGAPRALFSVVGRVMKDVMKPLFEVYIPKLKTGAFADTMGQWMRANPTASRAQKEAAAREIWDSIDNRFGESVNDNIFWKQHMKQIAMLSMRSYSWNVGTIREIGGGIVDAASHKMTPRVAYTIALPVVYGTIGALYQYMKTGEAPKDTQDLVAPRTGGTDPATGLPERMIMPGYMKDVFGWHHNPIELASHKLSTFVTTAKELVTGKDWRGAPIAPPPEDPSAPYELTSPPWLSAYLQHVAGKLVPISVRDLSRGEKEGSNITMAERALGIQPGGQKYVNPEGLKAYERYKKLKEWRSKEAFDARQESYYGGVE
jgi:hypothetical protein